MTYCIGLTKFAQRQFSPDFPGTKIPSEQASFLAQIQDINLEHPSAREGEFSFSRLITLPNHWQCSRSTVPLTLENFPYLRSSYEARTPTELPVLTRWLELPPGFEPGSAENITLVLYSKSQLEKENPGIKLDYEWGIVAILAHDGPEPEPIPPITMFRNALGVAEGGNGETINPEKYLISVKFWQQNVLVK